jgi:predicted nucleic acid-binding protein
MEAAGVEIFISTIVDYEVRRELIRIGAAAKLLNLDDLAVRFDRLDISAAAMVRAAEYWALVRRRGRPTAHPEALDADCILAGQSVMIGMPDNVVTIATNNVGHFGRFPGIDAREWTTITQ